MSNPSKREKETQSNCSLLTKLPSELRHAIWKECLGGMTFHLRVILGRLWYSICQTPPSSKICQNFNCWAVLSYLVYARRNRTQRSLLSLLLTCRQIYSEAVSYLYRANTFHATSIDCLTKLPSLLGPRLSTIRLFRYSYDLTSTPLLEHALNPVRSTLWRSLAAMKGLEDLRVEFYLPVRGPRGRAVQEKWIGSESRLLLQAGAVTAPSRFVVVLPFPEEAGAAKLEGLPCSIERVCGQMWPGNLERLVMLDDLHGGGVLE